MAFLAGSPGPGELVVLFLVILVLFGPRRLPEIARMLGRALEELRRASAEFRRHVMDIEHELTDEDTAGPKRRSVPAARPEGGGDAAAGEADTGGEGKERGHDLAG